MGLQVVAFLDVGLMGVDSVSAFTSHLDYVSALTSVVRPFSTCSHQLMHQTCAAAAHSCCEALAFPHCKSIGGVDSASTFTSHLDHVPALASVVLPFLTCSHQLMHWTCATAAHSCCKALAFPHCKSIGRKSGYRT